MAKFSPGQKSGPILLMSVYAPSDWNEFLVNFSPSVLCASGDAAKSKPRLKPNYDARGGRIKATIDTTNMRKVLVSL
jgi:hypothetical protein